MYYFVYIKCTVSIFIKTFQAILSSSSSFLCFLIDDNVVGIKLQVTVYPRVATCFFNLKTVVSEG